MTMGTEENKLFESLYEKWFSPVFAYFSVCLGSDLAEELSQETFMRVWTKCSQTAPDNWQAWIFRIAVNLKNDRLREKYKNTDLHSQIENNLDLKETEKLDSSLEVKEAFAALNSDDREILSLKAAGFSSDEIGELLGMTASGARSRLQRAKRNFLHNLDMED